MNRLGQKIMLPIMLSREFRSDLVMAFTVVPAAAYTALHYGYLEPRKHADCGTRLGDLRSANAELIAERREAALEAREVLRDQACKRARQELHSVVDSSSSPPFTVAKNLPPTPTGDGGGGRGGTHLDHVKQSSRRGGDGELLGTQRSRYRR